MQIVAVKVVEADPFMSTRIAERFMSIAVSATVNETIFEAVDELLAGEMPEIIGAVLSTTKLVFELSAKPEL